MNSALRAVLNVFGFVWWCVRRPWIARRRRVPWVWVALGERLEELPRARPGVWGLLGRARSGRVASVYALAEIARAVERAPSELGVIVHVRAVGAGWATLESVRAVLLGLRERGRKLVVYLEEGADQRALFVASAAGEVWIGPSAGVTVLGPVSRRTYIAPLLRRIGVNVATSAAGDYKSAADGLVRDGMSAPDREQRAALLGAVLQRWSEALGAKVGESTARTALDEAVLAPARAQSLRLVDRVAYLDELEEAHGIGPGRRALTPAALRGPLLPYRWRPLRRLQHVAVVRLTGPIGGGRGIGLGETRRVLRRLRDDRQVAAVLLFIDSPGGSAVASDLIHREVELLARAKPVEAVFGDVAASGGYYIAAPARRIWARATTITGSIGVISIRAALAELLARAGVNVESLAATPAADLFRFTTPLTAEEAALLEHETARFYARFVEVVATGRKRSKEDVLRVAGGRVWAGADALGAGLVDGLGGLPEALAGLHSELSGNGARLGEPVLYAAPGGESLLARVRGELRASDALSALPIDPLLDALTLLRASQQGPLAWAPGLAIDVP